MPASILGSMPREAGLTPPRRDAMEVAVLVLGELAAADVLGDLLSSLFELALDGGLGDGEALEPLGEGADLESFPEPLLPFPKESIPGTPKGFIPGMLSPYMAAI